MDFKRMADLDLAGRRILIREDLNVPVKGGRITSDKRITAAIPSLRLALEQGATVLVMSHLGRPDAQRPASDQPEASLAPVADRLSELLQRPVRLARDWIDGVEARPGDLVLLENVRFLAGETSDDETLARKMAALCDIFVMDAFGTAHRAHASTHGVVKFAPEACAGPLLSAELDALRKALANPARPLVAVVGGAKVSGKLPVLARLAELADQVIVGGGIANTFLKAQGHEIGTSLVEEDLVSTAAALMAKTAFPLPTDVVVAPEFSASAKATTVATDAVPADQMILDIGPDTAKAYASILEHAGTILWNGPLGVFELAPFAAGTRAVANAIGASAGFSIAGGGDTLAAIDQFGVGAGVSYISTGGGAFLEYVEGKTLPAVAALMARS